MNYIYRVLQLRLFLLLQFLLLLLPASPAEEDKSDVEMISEIVDWIRTNGGWISDKIEVKQIAGALSGIFSKEDLAKGEVIADIPWQLILKVESEEANWCDTVENIRTTLLKTPLDQTPYERYLTKRSPTHIPHFWSNVSKTLLKELMEDIYVNGFYNDLNGWWTEECERPGDDVHYRAMMLLQTRGEGEDINLLVPFGDLINHRNGKYTNAENRIEYGKYHQIRTLRAVKAGEEIQSSYNQCGFCEGLFSNPEDAYTFQVTPQLFEIYGFVEPVPQRWVIPRVRLMFDIIYAEDDEDEEEDDLAVDFIAPPSWSGLVFLRQRLQFLEEFEEKLEGRTDIPIDELNGLLSFHSALVNAFALALEHLPGEASEEVWLLRDDDWYRENQTGDTDEL